jgi:hypothetical protein
VSRVVEYLTFSLALARENWDILQRVTLIYLFRQTMVYAISDTTHRSIERKNVPIFAQSLEIGTRQTFRLCLVTAYEFYRVKFTFLPRNGATLGNAEPRTA